MGVEFVIFPSPIGELHFSIFSLNSTKLFPQRFPSPIGELHFSILQNCNGTFIHTSFPSPIGELHFSILIKSSWHFRLIRFRPLSGSYISQYWKKILWKWCHIVSVPYRGATFLNRYSWCTWWNDRKFPSPIGELHFSIGMSNLFNVPVKVSVPYRGATFLNSLWFSHYIVDHCFRPLSGSYISQYCTACMMKNSTLSFRPLSGSYISQWKSVKVP